MASFYGATGNQGHNGGFGGDPNANPNPGADGYSSGGGAGGSGFQQFQQQPQQQQQHQQQQQQQPGFTSNVQQWQAQPQGQQSYGQSSQQQQQAAAQPFWSPNVQQAATQAAAGFMAQAATGNLTSEKVLSQGMDEIQKAFGGGIPGMNYVMRTLRSYFQVDNRYVKRKLLNVLFPFLNKQWRRDVSRCNLISCYVM